MGYLLLAICCSALVSVVMRMANTRVNNKMGMFMANYLTCVFFSFLFMPKTAVSVSSSTITLGIISGVLYLVAILLLELNMQYNGIVMASTFMKLGVLIPTLMAIFVFKEVPKWTQIIGMIIAVMAIIMIHYEKTSLKQATNKKLLLLVLLVQSGCTDAMANIFDKSGFAHEKDMYLVFTFLVAFLCAGFLVIKAKKKIDIKDIFSGICIGVPNYFASLFLLLSLTSVPSILVYPIFSVGTIILITLIGCIFFKEVLSKQKQIALFCIIIAICLLNV